MAEAIAAYATAVKTGELGRDGNPNLTAHIGNARRRDSQIYNDQGERLFSIAKERPDSPHKIDLAMAAVLSWEARRDALSVPVVEETEPRFAQCDGSGRLIRSAGFG
jgi:phage terminase large subunit-like protein